VRRRLARLAPFVLLPWSWFLVRDLHPATDVAAIGLPVLVVASVVTASVVAVLRRRLAPVATAASWALFGLAAVVLPWAPRPGEAPERPLRIVAANVRGGASQPRILDDVDARRPDVVVLSELGAAPLAGEYGAVLLSEPRSPGRAPDVAVATDLPVRDLGLPDGLDRLQGVRARVETRSGPVVVYGVHLPPPRVGPSGDWEVSVREHRQVVARLRDAVAAEDLPVVVAGDLNLVDRAWGYRALTGVLDDAMRSTWLRPTARRASTLPLLGRVDHVLVDESWCSGGATVFALTGSDHLGVATSVGRCPSP